MVETPIRWTSFRALEPNPHPYTPMTQSILERGLSTSNLVDVVQQESPIGTFHRGYLYLNFDDLHRIMGSFFDIPQETLLQYLRDDINVELNEIRFRPSIDGVKLLLELSTTSTGVIFHGLRINQRLPDQPSVEEQTDAELQSLMDIHHEFLTKSISSHVIFSALAEAYAVGIERYIPKSPSRQRIQNIISDSTNSKTSEMAQWASHLETDTDREQFFNEFGHRCPREMEIAVPRWRDDPSALSNISPQSQQEDSGKDTPDSLVKTVTSLALLPGSVLEQLRENPKNDWLKSYAYLRDILIEIGHRGIEIGHFTVPEDVFYISFHDAQKLLDDPPSRQHIRSIVKENRSEQQFNESYSTPQFTDKNFQPVGISEPSIENNDLIQGLGVSEGTISGTVITAQTPGEVHIPDDSESHILVTEYTDAGWTPLFFQIDGLVMERGSLLSHGSIVAREAEIPAVVNVDTVSDQVESGDKIEINGTDGTVELVNK